MASTSTASFEALDAPARERLPAAHALDGSDSTDTPPPKGRLSRLLEATVAKRLGHRYLIRLAAHRGDVSVALRELPERMHLTARQTQLMLELIDDFRSGAYRRIAWHSLAIATAAILYAASPADIVPDMLLGIGVLDDIAVSAIAARLLSKELKAYCEFKGYAVENYFGRRD